MDNNFSQATIKLPTIPSDFAARAGSTKEQFAQAIFDLLSGAQVQGINLEQPQNFDLAEIQNRVTKLENAAPGLDRKQRAVTLAGVANGLVVVPFEDIETTSYVVNVIFITPGSNINTVTWSLVEGSKQSNQVTLWLDGDSSTYNIQVQITELK